MAKSKPDKYTIDPNFYRIYYGFDAIISQMSDDEVRNHYNNYGIDEGRYCSADQLIDALSKEHGLLPEEFDEEFYIAANSDVKTNFRIPRGGAAHYLMHGRSEGRRPSRESLQVYDKNILNLITNRVYDLPQVVVDPDATVYINVLVPAFEFRSMSAGFFGVFQIALFIKKCGLNVRLVMFDNFYWNEEEFRDKLKGYPGMEDLFDELAVCYIGERLQPLIVSPNDNCVATVWYSAHFAETIMKKINNLPFLYLIQDYETNFYPGSSLAALADATYSMKYTALFSTEPLMKQFLSDRIGAFGASPPPHTYFNNACSSRLLPKKDFLRRSSSKHRRLALYSRPIVNRNMFELAALSLCAAYERGVFEGHDWEFIGIGLGDAAIRLSPSVELRQIPRMNLAEYQDAIASFDIGLSLMASPHPSLLPFDLGGSGAIVVTNTYKTKQQDYFDGISRNIIARPATLETMVEGLREAVSRVDDFGARYHNSKSMRYPRSWDETFSIDHRSFVRQTFRSSLNDG